MKLSRRQFQHLAAGAMALPIAATRSKRASLALAPRALDRRLRARRRQRHRRAPDGAVVLGAAGPALPDREPPRRRHQHGGRGGRARGARRLHAAAGRPAQRDQRDALRDAALQLHPRHRPGRRHHDRAERDGDQSVVSGADRSRVHRLRQGQSRQGQHGVGRQRQRGPSRRRTVHVDDRRQHGPCALSRPGAGDRRRAGRTGAGAVRHLSRLDGARQGRQAEGAGRHHGGARRGAARPADRGRLRAGLRGERVVRRRRAAQDARRHHRAAEQGNQCRPRRPQAQGPPGRPRRHPDSRLARPVRQADRRQTPRSGPRSSARPTSRCRTLATRHRHADRGAWSVTHSARDVPRGSLSCA